MSVEKREGITGQNLKDVSALQDKEAFVEFERIINERVIEEFSKFLLKFFN